ncbi:hypothetical protein HK104_003118, partial [Borealophlyctis nickersoniae]
MKVTLAISALLSISGIKAAPAPQVGLPPLGGVLPPTPIVPVGQVLTAPLDVPFNPPALKPKKLIYTWTGADDRTHKDFIATFSADDDTFGTLIAVTTVPTSGNEPHHIGVSGDGNHLVGGGLLALLKAQDTAYYFDITNKYRPQFSKSNRAVLGSITDEVAAKPDGGFFITYMGSAGGTSPGRLIETNANFDIIAEHPQDLSQIGTLYENFNPHGLAIDFARNTILTSDYIVPLSSLKPTTGVVFDNTVRVWDLDTRSIVNTIEIPNGGGIQDVRFIPNHPRGYAIATAVKLGQVWLIDPHTNNASGNRGTARLLYDLGADYAGKFAIYSTVSKDGKFLYLSVTDANRIVVLDISDVDAVKRVDDPTKPQPVVGPHYLKLTPDGKNLIVTDYFVREGELGVINTGADYKLWYIDVNPTTGAISFNRTIDFAQKFAFIGGARPHSSAYYDSTYTGP